MNENDLQYFIKIPLQYARCRCRRQQWQRHAPSRGYGTNARVLGRYVRELQMIELEDAIRRMTSLPAQKFGLHIKDPARRILMQIL